MLDIKESMQNHFEKTQKDSAELARETLNLLSQVTSGARTTLEHMSILDVVMLSVVVAGIMVSLLDSRCIFLPFVGIGIAMCYAVIRIALIESKTDNAHIGVPLVKGSANIGLEGAEFVPISIADGHSWFEWQGEPVENIDAVV